MLAFSGRGFTSAVINLSTWGWPFRRPAKWTGFSHVGVVGMHPDFCDELALWESTTASRLPCLLEGRPVRGVQSHGIWGRTVEYTGAVWHYPLMPEARGCFNSEAAQAFLWDASRHPYDYRQAFDARDTLLGRLCRRLCRLDPGAAYYCSELVAGCWRAGFGYFGETQYSPNRLLRAARRLGVIGGGTRLK